LVASGHPPENQMIISSVGQETQLTVYSAGDPQETQMTVCGICTQVAGQKRDIDSEEGALVVAGSILPGDDVAESAKKKKKTEHISADESQIMVSSPQAAGQKRRIESEENALVVANSDHFVEDVPEMESTPKKKKTEGQLEVIPSTQSAAAVNNQHIGATTSVDGTVDVDIDEFFYDVDSFDDIDEVPPDAEEVEEVDSNVVFSRQAQDNGDLIGPLLEQDNPWGY
jgi:hypothetical protein